MELYIHIGYAKSATTFQQKNLFPQLPNLKYGGREYSQEKTPANLDWVYNFVFSEEFDTQKYVRAIKQLGGGFKATY